MSLLGNAGKQIGMIDFDNVTGDVSKSATSK